VKFDIISYLDSTGISYREKGKNVMKEHVAIACPLHEDKSAHMNLRVDGSHSYCLNCGHQLFDSVKILRLLNPNDELSVRECMEIMSQFPWEGEVEEQKKDVVQSEQEKRVKAFNELWDSFRPLGSMGRKYLESRGHNVMYADRFGLREGIGKYDWCVVLPVKDQLGNVVSFKSRSVGKKVYKNCPDDESIMFVGDCLFGLYESLRKTDRKYIVVVEGEFDALKLLENGIPAVALMKKVMTQGQRELLLYCFKPDVTVFLALDSDVSDRERWEREQELSVYFNMVKSVHICGVKDTGELSQEDVERLKSCLDGFVL